jgi:antitoxin CptB
MTSAPLDLALVPVLTPSLTPAMSAVEVRRLGWRCRRGLLELDIVLQRFSAQHLAGLSADELAAFDMLLDYSDNELLDVVTLRVEFAQADIATAAGLSLTAMQQLLAKLRNSKMNLQSIEIAGN